MGGLRCQKQFSVFCIYDMFSNKHESCSWFSKPTEQKTPSDFSRLQNYNIIYHLIHFINRAPEFQYQAIVPVKPLSDFPQEEPQSYFFTNFLANYRADFCKSFL